MKKYLDDVLFEKLNKIPIDKYIHFIFAIVLYFIFSIISKLSFEIHGIKIIPFGKLCIVITICGLKEFTDVFFKKESFNYSDFYAGVLGSVLIFLNDLMAV